MNRKGSLFTSALIALMLFLVGLLIVNFLKEPIDNARIDLSCDDSANISSGNKLMCLGVDSVIIYFIVLVFSVAGGAILDKFVI